MINLRAMRYRLALVVNKLFFPFTFPDVFEAFQARNFTLAGSTASRVPVALGAQLYISGPFATKEDVVIDLDHDRKILGAEGKDLEALTRIFWEVLDIARADFHLTDRDTDYVELSAAFLVKTDKAARQSIEAFFSRNPNLAGVKLALGFDPVIRQFTLSEKGKPPEGKEYVEFNVAHRLTAQDTYYVQAVFRHPQMSEAMEFVKNVNAKVISLIEAMEGS